jgi:hypothetical protein
MCSEHRVTSLRSPRRSRHPPRRSNEMSFLNRRTNARVILYRFLPPERRAPVVIPRVARRRVRRQLDAHAPGNRRGHLSRSSRPSAPLAARASPHPRGFVTIEKHAIQRVRRVARGRLPPEGVPHGDGGDGPRRRRVVLLLGRAPALRRRARPDAQPRAQEGRVRRRRRPRRMRRIRGGPLLRGDGVHQARSIHWSPYDRVGVVNADP